MEEVNYYERHLGDYARDAGHLSMLEHGAYSLLLDRLYTTEQGIPADQAHRICRVRTKDERAAVDAVLAEFFHLKDGAYINGRAMREIAKAQTKIKAARENGKAGGRPKRTKEKPTGLELGSISETQQKAHQTPDTKQRHSEAIASGGEPPGPDPKDVVFGLGVPMLTAAGVKESNGRSFLAMQCKAHGDGAVAAALEACAIARPVQPIPWLQERLKPKPAAGLKASKHTGFESKNYHDGVTEDGHIA